MKPEEQKKLRGIKEENEGRPNFIEMNHFIFISIQINIVKININK